MQITGPQALKERNDAVTTSSDVVNGLNIFRSPWVGFSIPPSYSFTIAETGQTFSSSEKHPRLAYQEHLKQRNHGSCREFLFGH